MTREVIFKGLSIETQEQVEGYFYVDFTTNDYIIFTEKGSYKVAPKTVCEYSGCRDLTGNRIFEYDILKESDTGYCYIVLFLCGCFVARDMDPNHDRMFTLQHLIDSHVVSVENNFWMIMESREDL